MKLVWTLPAQRDFKEAVDYISLDNPAAARRFTQRVRKAAAYLKDFPQLGKPGLHENTRDFHIAGTSYYCVYQISDTRIDIIRLLHHKQLWI